MATSAQVAQYRAANQSLVLLAQRDLTDFWGALNVFGDPTRVRDELLRFYPDLITTYGDTAALLGADWYDQLRNVPASAKSFQVVMASPPPIVQAQASARWGLGPLFQADPDPALALARLNGSTQRLVLQAGRDTIWESARRDPVKTRVARVPSGTETCAFCIMLASRGAVYTSLESAGELNEFHDWCDCVPTVIRSGDDYPEGHDLNEFRRLYAEGSGVGRDIPVDA